MILLVYSAHFGNSVHLEVKNYGSDKGRYERSYELGREGMPRGQLYIMSHLQIVAEVQSMGARNITIISVKPSLRFTRKG